MVIAVTDRYHLYPGGTGREHIVARIADKQALPGGDARGRHDVQQPGRIGLLDRQGVAADDPRELPQALLFQQRCNDAIMLVGDHAHGYDALSHHTQQLMYTYLYL